MGIADCDSGQKKSGYGCAYVSGLYFADGRLSAHYRAHDSKYVLLLAGRG